MQFFLIKLFSIIKFRSVAWLIDHAGIFIAWVFNVFISLLLVAIATWTVVMVAPAAAGGCQTVSASPFLHCRTLSMRHGEFVVLLGLITACHSFSCCANNQVYVICCACSVPRDNMLLLCM
jgi:hypothetical protein